MAKVKLKARDLPRFVPDVKTPRKRRHGIEPWCVQSAVGQYGRADAKEGKIVFRRSDHSTPPFSRVTPITQTGTDFEPHAAYTADQHLILLFTRERDSSGDSSDVFEVRSSDGGRTWSSPEMAFKDGKHPTLAVSPLNGTILRASYVAGQIHLKRTNADDRSPLEITAKDSAGNALAVADDTFHLAQALDGAGRWLLVVRLGAESDVSEWESTDNGKTWARADK